MIAAPATGDGRTLVISRTETLDFRSGGSWRHVMIGPDGREYPTDNVILEVIIPDATHYSIGNDPRLAATVAGFLDA
ncbi:MAG: hypothetical protein BGO82_19445 [Devosia sp. 67-54]|uniref:hypothetical protein n=1 Tax=unclassified Devosia TaxID=196773 RepID=UPI0009627104|nr:MULTISPECIES: hypothetical protein [unclassified Devosia]MBN9306268.1 hypothetical protein [Devosia sp.]OJX18340.1 MAG: hypothetical protein BGO82_19445 [Devosia sp. 67-54]